MNSSTSLPTFWALWYLLHLATVYLVPFLYTQIPSFCTWHIFFQELCYRTKKLAKTEKSATEKSEKAQTKPQLLLLPLHKILSEFKMTSIISLNMVHDTWQFCQGLENVLHGILTSVRSSSNFYRKYTNLNKWTSWSKIFSKYTFILIIFKWSFL